MNSSGAVHVTMRSQNASQTEIYSDDSLSDSGRQVITLSNGPSKLPTATIDGTAAAWLPLSASTGVISSSALLGSGPISA